MSSLTSSQSSEAKACRHLPGHPLNSSVFVMDPRSPEKQFMSHVRKKKLSNLVSIILFLDNFLLLFSKGNKVLLKFEEVLN
jgi:hypothetical protein